MRTSQILPRLHRLCSFYFHTVSARSCKQSVLHTFLDTHMLYVRLTYRKTILALSVLCYHLSSGSSDASGLRIHSSVESYECLSPHSAFLSVSSSDSDSFPYESLGNCSFPSFDSESSFFPSAPSTR